jgi:hypothetical protein
MPFLLRPAALGDVLHEAVVADELAAGIVLEHGRVPNPAEPAVLMAKPVLDRFALMSCEELLGLLSDLPTVVLVDHLKPQMGIGGELLGGVAGHCDAARSVTGLHRSAIFDAHRVDVVRQRLRKAAKTPLTRDQDPGVPIAVHCVGTHRGMRCMHDSALLSAARDPIEGSVGS